MDEPMLEGNAVCWLVQEVFAVEMTTAAGICGSCDAAGPVRAVHGYRATVLDGRAGRRRRPLRQVLDRQRGPTVVVVHSYGGQIGPRLAPTHQTWSHSGKPSTYFAL